MRGAYTPLSHVHTWTYEVNTAQDINIFILCLFCILLCDSNSQDISCLSAETLRLNKNLGASTHVIAEKGYDMCSEC